jgi:hypothetical protein
MSPTKKLAYGLGLIPYTLFSFFMALLRFPRYAGQRRYILDNRRHGRFWLFKELWKRRLPAATPLAGG